jgi:hypothetical protein
VAWNRLNQAWYRSRGLRREIALGLLVKTLLLVALARCLAPAPGQPRADADATAHHLLGTDAAAARKPEHGR